MLNTDNKLALPQGSLILVTGASGFIASNFIVEALEAGYRVRGTARSADKVQKTRDIFNSPNYDGIVGVDAVVHMASPLTFDPDPSKVVVPAMKGATSILRSAKKEPKIKRFVFTSSSQAATLPRPGKKFKINKNSWNNDIEQWVNPSPPFLPENGVLVYAASKTKAEHAVWEFVKNERPNFIVNTILPSFNIGRAIVSSGARSFAANQQQSEDLSEVDNAQGAELLNRWYGQDGYTPMKESVRQNVQQLT
ncbi:hypothetical protein LCI18_013552 [Fusarium solani-melongenae]|uniref:Uncharacterized protein n=1 Tax=Fusarium solani subsp. cucurbitae TaxID=2747967 RepID=A0ACD3ZN45_FUSSC|nr:hypothetical protein LCI18_013552 [Fusarium solani-melongenae]